MASRTKKNKSPIKKRGLSPKEAKGQAIPKKVEISIKEIEAEGGVVLSPYREPLGGHWVLFCCLPIDQVQPSPYQRKLSVSHMERLIDVIDKTSRFLDPVIALKVDKKHYQVPNGNHRLSALKEMGGKSIMALVVLEKEVGRMMLALNCEKAHALRDKSGEVVLLAKHLAQLDEFKEYELALEFELPCYITLGLCYEKNGRFAGSAYFPLLKRVDKFLRRNLSNALIWREEMANDLLEIDQEVSQVVTKLKEKGFESPYLKNYVVAKINPLRFNRKKNHGLKLEDALSKMKKTIKSLNVNSMKKSDLLKTVATSSN